MIVAPFTISKTKTQKGIDIYRIRLLCQGGHQPWTEENQPIEDVLEPNSIFTNKTKTITLSNGTKCILAEVNIKKTEILSMYDWHEIDNKDNETLCWRTFTFGVSGTTLWLPPIKNDCTPIIEEIYKLHAHI
jgi:hypothetical protein